MTKKTEQLIAYLRAAAQIKQGEYFSELSTTNLAFIEKYTIAMETGRVTPELIEDLLIFLKNNQELIEADLSPYIVEQQTYIRQYILKLIARALNLSTQLR